MFMVAHALRDRNGGGHLCVAVPMGTGPAAEQQRNSDSGSRDSALVDLTSAVVVTPAELNLQQRTAIRVLVEEDREAHGVRLRVSAQWPAETRPRHCGRPALDRLDLGRRRPEGTAVSCRAR